MTREETIKLLQMMRAAYPNVKITDPAGTVAAWELAFSDFPADMIYKAARHHLNTSPYFPLVADIRKSINKGAMLYSEDPEQKKIAPSAPDRMIPVQESFCDLCGLCDKRDQSLCEY